MTGFLFNRDLLVSIGAQSIPMVAVDPLTGKSKPLLRTSFTVERELGRDPNRATISIHNLNPMNRALLQQGSELAAASPLYEWPLIIEAGYVGNRGQIFAGDVTVASSMWNGVDWITSIEAEDGGKKYSRSRIRQSFGPQTPLVAVLNVCAAALGVGLGNSAAKFAAARRGVQLFKRGVVLKGKAADVLNKYIVTAGFTWSIQDGQLQVLEPSGVIVGLAVGLNSDTGLIGSPERGEKGVVIGRSLVQNLIAPGRQINLQSATVSGSYRTEKVTHSGDTWGNDWYSNFEGKPLS